MIFAICLAKNEADIIVHTLRRAIVWCDKVFVFDNGSSDGTWSEVLDLARSESRIVPYRSAAVPFRDSLRQEVFDRFRHESSVGDWWCRLDADEIYHDDPRRFLAAVPSCHHVVWAATFQYYFTDRDVEAWSLNRDLYSPFTPAELALQYFRCEYSEWRFFRYRRRLIWDSGSAPRHMGVVHPRRIRLKHYQYRSPEQIDLRLKTRRQAIAEGCGTFSGYCMETDWREKVVAAATCDTAMDGAPLVINESALPQHLERPLHRLLKVIMHGSRLWA